MGGMNDQNIPRIISGIVAASILLWTALNELQTDRLPLMILASGYLLLICYVDTLHSRIPNILTFALALTGGAFHFWSQGFAGLGFAAAGLAVGLLLLIVPYALGGMGAGDVKCLAALGAVVGPAAIFQVFLYMALAGGVLAIVHLLLAPDLRQRIAAMLGKVRSFLYLRNLQLLVPEGRPEKLRFPYAAAIIFGFCAFEQWGRLI